MTHKPGAGFHACILTWGLQGRAPPSLHGWFCVEERSNRTATPGGSPFLEYMEDPATYRWIIMGEDITENRVPRYLISRHEYSFSSRTD